MRINVVRTHTQKGFIAIGKYRFEDTKSSAIFFL